MGLAVAQTVAGGEAEGEGESVDEAGAEGEGVALRVPTVAVGLGVSTGEVEGVLPTLPLAVAEGVGAGVVEVVRVPAGCPPAPALLALAPAIGLEEVLALPPPPCGEGVAGAVALALGVWEPEPPQVGDTQALAVEEGHWLCAALPVAVGEPAALPVGTGTVGELEGVGLREAAAEGLGSWEAEAAPLALPVLVWLAVAQAERLAEAVPRPVAVGQLEAEGLAEGCGVSVELAWELCVLLPLPLPLPWAAEGEGVELRLPCLPVPVALGVGLLQWLGLRVPPCCQLGEAVELPLCRELWLPPDCRLGDAVPVTLPVGEAEAARELLEVTEADRLPLGDLEGEGEAVPVGVAVGLPRRGEALPVLL